MLNTTELKINRIIIHRVDKKRDDNEFGYAEYSENLFSFGEPELKTLKDRIGTAFSKAKRFFKLEIAHSGENSFYQYSKKIKGCSIDEFISISKSTADLLAISHNKKTIPAGLLLIFDGTLSNKHFVLVIKAELHEAFTIKEIERKKIVELINDIFLSPAKDFYKIGLIVEDINKLVPPNDLYSCYMYDDNFSSGKRDLAEYFYNGFLGFTSSQNDKLLTKNFKDDFYKFVEKNVVGYDDKKGFKNALIALYREDTTGVINPVEFAKTYLPDNLFSLFNQEINSKYPQSFVKDLSLVEKGLLRGHIRLVDDLKIEGPLDSIDKVSISNANNFDTEMLKMQIEKGEISQVVIIKAET